MTIKENLPFDPRDRIQVGAENFIIYRLDSLEEAGLCVLDKLPYSIRILLENLLRGAATGTVSFEELRSLAGWSAELKDPAAIPFMPARVVLQDFTGVPALVDLAAMRSAMARSGAFCASDQISSSDEAMNTAINSLITRPGRTNL